MNILPLFPSNVIVDSINKNTDQLKNNTIFHPTNNNYDPTKEIELDFKALKRYPRIAVSYTHLTLPTIYSV